MCVHVESVACLFVTYVYIIIYIAHACTCLLACLLACAFSIQYNIDKTKNNRALQTGRMRTILWPRKLS